MNFIKILYFLICKKEIVFIASTLQYINFIEYKNLNKQNQSFFKKTKIFIRCNSRKEAKLIYNMNKKMNKGLNQILDLRKNMYNFLIFFLFKLRKFFNPIDLGVIGDYNNYTFKELYKVSKNRVILDDGTNALNFKNLFNLNKKNSKLFSFFDKKIFNHNKIIKNDFRFLKANIKNQKKEASLYILGNPWVQNGIVDFENYVLTLKKILKKYKKLKIFYLPHPKETNEILKKYSFLNIIKPNYPIEIFLITKAIIPGHIVGFNSTAFILIKKLYENKIKLTNINIKTKRSPFFNKISQYLMKNHKIISIKF